jgi:hypothetical protein
LTSPRTSAGAISQSFECFCGPLALAIRVSRPLLLQRRSKTGPRAVGSPNRSHKRFGKGCLADAPRPMDTAPSRARGPKHKAVSRGKIGNGPTAGGRRACEARTRTAPVVRLESHQCSGGSSTGAPQVSESRPSETSQSRRPYALMPFRPTTLERAYQLAESGACKNLHDIRACLRAEGFLDIRDKLYGLTTTRALQQRCRANFAGAVIFSKSAAGVSQPAGAPPPLAGGSSLVGGRRSRRDLAAPNARRA